jgi:hypothetical protein
MTTETSTTAISSVSGLNLTKNSNLKSNNYVQKRNVYQFETEKIEQQSTENSTCNTRLGKVSKNFICVEFFSLFSSTQLCCVTYFFIFFFFFFSDEYFPFRSDDIKDEFHLLSKSCIVLAPPCIDFYFLFHFTIFRVEK